jgi:hypothetical protein
MNMRYLDLLYNRKYFAIFLDYFNRVYNQREKRYEQLIKRYRSSTGQFAGLISDRTHIADLYESLGKEFNMAMRGAKLVPFEEFFESIQTHKQTIVTLTNYKMDGINPDAIPQSMLGDLKQLFEGLKVVPPTQKRKLVAVSKTLHFLLPDLVMPVDNAGVLRTLEKGEVPEDAGKQYDLFIEVLEEYLDLTVKLGLKQGNSDGTWWNISVPKRIDNAIAGIWGIFSDRHIKYLICNHTDMLLNYLKGQLTSDNGTRKVKWEDIGPFVKANPFEAAKGMKEIGWNRITTYNRMNKAGLASDEIDRILNEVYK